MATKLPKLEKRRRFGLKIGGKKKRIVAAHKNENKCFVAMELPKMGGKKKRNCGNGVAENWRRERERERIV